MSSERFCKMMEECGKPYYMAPFDQIPTGWPVTVYNKCGYLLGSVSSSENGAMWAENSSARKIMEYDHVMVRVLPTGHLFLTMSL